MAVDQLFFTVVVVLVAAKLLGEVFHRLKLPPMVGEVLAGIIVGPSLLGLVASSPDTALLSNLSVFFLVFLAGLSHDPKELLQAGRRAIIISAFSFAVPLLAGEGMSVLFGLGQVQAWFMALLMSITAVPVTAIILMQLGVMKTRLGNTVMTAAVINDIMSLIVLSLVMQASGPGSGHAIDSKGMWLLSINIGLFVGGIFLIDILLTSPRFRLRERLAPIFRMLRTREAVFGAVMAAAVGISLLAESIGLHFIIGTFFAGVLLNRGIIGKLNFDKVYGIISAVTFGFFAPIFFGLIGIVFHAQLLAASIVLFAGLFAVAVAGKIGGSYLGARLAGLPWDTSMTIGFLMNGRGAVELAIAAIGYSAGLINLTLFTVAVAVGVATTVIAPLTAGPFIAHAKARGNKSLEVEPPPAEG